MFRFLTEVVVRTKPLFSSYIYNPLPSVMHLASRQFPRTRQTCGLFTAKVVEV
jgi:hypothetical protein